MCTYGRPTDSYAIPTPLPYKRDRVRDARSFDAIEYLLSVDVVRKQTSTKDHVYIRKTHLFLRKTHTLIHAKRDTVLLIDASASMQPSARSL
eukprot:4453632-Pleurochrysis_carterae.AAC.1